MFEKKLVNRKGLTVHSTVQIEQSVFEIAEWLLYPAVMCYAVHCQNSICSPKQLTCKAMPHTRLLFAATLGLNGYVVSTCLLPTPDLLQGVLEALVKFMLNLEHLAVLLALLNTKKAGQTAMWRKKQYGKIMQLLDQQLVGHEYYVKQLSQVMSKMWASLPDVQRLGSAGKEKLHLGSALQRLGLMHLYIDSKADQTREDLAECKACTSQNAEAAAEAEAEAEIAADADEDSDTADAEYGDDNQSQPGEEDGVAAKRPDSAQASQTIIPSGSSCFLIVLF